MSDTSIINCPHCGKDINEHVGTPVVSDHGVDLPIVNLPVWQTHWEPPVLPSRGMTNE